MTGLALQERLEALQSAIASGDGAVVASSLAAIDEALNSGRKELDPQLKHYLRNRSYGKALAYLQGRSDIPKGRCGGRTDFT